jgi:uncharacterized membrane protein
LKDFSLSKKQEKKIIQAIQLAEQNTSGEIRVHIDAEPNGNHLDIAAEVFMALKMDQTRDRNGVLFHVSPKDHNFTVIGDIGITAVVPDDFWEEIKEAVIKKFKKENYVKGLIKGIEMAGTALQKYFPYKDDDKNELPDEISWG